MKEKNTILFLVCFTCLICSKELFSQTNPLVIADEFTDCYTHSYIISDVGTSNVYDQPASNNVYVAGFHGQPNQQWLIMPTYPGSNKAFVISRRNGYIVDRSLISQNVYCYAGHFHGGTNQLWRIGESGSGYAVYSYGTTKVWDRPNSGDIYCANYHGGSNQTITFTSNASLGNNYSTQTTNYNVSASMPPELNSLNEQFEANKQVGKVLQSVTVIPFTLINDPGWNLSAQLNYSPYYRLEKYQYWKLIDYKQYLEGDVSEYTSTTSIGCVTENSETIKTIMNVSYAYNAKLTVPIDGIAAEVGENIKVNMGVDYTLTNSVTYSYKDDVEYKFTRTSTQDQTFFFYVLIDEYKLYRMNETGNNYLLRWEYSNPDLDPYFKSYPNTTQISASNCSSSSNQLPENSIPVKSSNTSSPGIASASSQYSSTYAAWKAFDGEDESGSGSRWISANNGPFSTQWIAYDFQTTANVQSYAIEIEHWLADRSPNTWKLQGFNGSAWVTVDSRSNYTITKWEERTIHYFTVPQTASYSKFRLLVESVNGSTVVSIIKFKLFATNIIPTKSTTITDSQDKKDKSEVIGNLMHKFSVYPNPSSGNIIITINNEALSYNKMFDPDSVSTETNSGYLTDRKFVVDIYDSKGAIVKKLHQDIGTESYNLGLPSGIYLIKCNIGGKDISKKMIIK